jgi:hypothetical protein
MLYSRLALSLLALPLLSGGVLNYTFTGAISASAIGAYPVGTLFSGVFAYDNAPTFDTSGGSFINYLSTAATPGATVGLDSYTTQFPLHESATQYGVAEDEVALWAEIPAAQLQAVAPGAVYGEMVLRFHYPFNSQFSGGLVMPANLAPGAVGGFELLAYFPNPQGGLGGAIAATGTMRQYEEAQVPEPATIALAGAGLLLVGVLRRRRARG